MTYTSGSQQVIKKTPVRRQFSSGGTHLPELLTLKHFSLLGLPPRASRGCPEPCSICLSLIVVYFYYLQFAEASNPV